MVVNYEEVVNNCIYDNKNSFNECEISTCEDSIGNGYERFIDNGDKLSGKMMISSYIDEDNKRKTFIKNNSHVIGIGATGSGKTQCYINPELEFLAKHTDSNFFIVDIKGEIYRNKAELFKKEGYDVYLINLNDPYSSNKFNPLHYPFHEFKKAEIYESELKRVRLEKTKNCKTFLGKTYKSTLECQNVIKKKILEAYDNAYSTLHTLSEQIIPITSTKEPSWDYASRDIVYRILCGMLEDSKIEDRKMNKYTYNFDTLNAILTTTKNDYEYLNEWYASHPGGCESKKLSSYFSICSEKTRDSYMSNTAAHLSRFINLPIKYITSNNDFNFEEICQKADSGKIAIFCMLDESKPISYEIAMMLISQLADNIRRYADSNGGSLKKDFHLFLDEFCNMPKFPNIERIISTFRSRKIWLHMMIQSISQLDNRYGVNIRNLILDNSNTHIFFGSNNSETLNIFSSSFGTKCGAITTYNIASNGNMMVNINPIQTPVVKVSDLMNLKLGEAYVKCIDAPSIKTLLTPDFLSPDFSHGNSIPESKKVDLDILSRKSYDIVSIMKPIIRERRDQWFDN